MRKFYIDNDKFIDQSSRSYLIAEIGHNHQGSLEQCIKMFKVAKECGADAVKIQKRDNKNLYTKKFYDSKYNSPNSYGQSYGEHRDFLEFGEEEFKELIKASKELKIDFFSTAFDENSLNFLLKIGIKMIKVASADIKNLYLLEKIAESKVPFIISTGGSDMKDVQDAVNLLLKFHNNFAILQCTSGYPAEFEELNLNVIETYMNKFPDQIIGLSSHDNGIAMPIVAHAIGARIIEKHFTLNRTFKGTDHAFSLEPAGLRKLSRDLKRTQLALGDGVKKVFESEKEPIEKMAKMIVSKIKIKKGDKINLDNITFKSPCIGIDAKNYKKIIGKNILVDLDSDEPLTFDMFQF